jgi:hypothetical protein
MSASRFEGFRRFFRTCLAGAAGLTVAAAGLAQDPADTEALEQVRKRAEVAAQKTESEVRDLLREVREIKPADQAKVAERLKTALSTLEADDNLPAGRRDVLARSLRERIRTVEANGPKSADEVLAEQKARANRRRPAKEAPGAPGADEARQRFAEIRDLQKNGQTADASRKAGDFAKDRPVDPAVQASASTANATHRAADARRLKLDGEARRFAALREVENAAQPPRWDVEFPKDWAIRTKDRGTAVKLTVKEKSLLQALNTPVTVSFKGTRFEEVIEYLQTTTGQTILVDKTALDEAQITYETPVTVSAKGVTVRTLLRKVLNDLGLAYIIKDEAIQAVTVQRARESLVVRSYYIGDLLAGLYTLPGVGFGAGSNPAQSQVVVNMLIDTIQTSVDAQSWKSNNGPGTITFSPATMSLVISASAEVHALLANGGLR